MKFSSYGGSGSRSILSVYFKNPNGIFMQFFWISWSLSDFPYGEFGEQTYFFFKNCLFGCADQGAFYQELALNTLEITQVVPER